MKTGIVVLNYNDSKTTIELLNKIKDYKTLDLIVVVDNNSTDNSYKILTKYENDKIKVIESGKNNGYGYGNNVGCKYLVERNYDYIIISNPDVIFEDKDIKELSDSFQNENIAIVAPVVNEHGTLNRGWKFQNAFVDSLSNINYIGRYFKKKRLYKDEHYNGKFSEVDVVSGCFFMVKAKYFEQINYFDENIFLYYEENIIAKRLKKIGKKILINNNVTVVHNHSVSVDKSLNKINKFKRLTKSQRYYHKNYNKTGIFGMLCLYISYYIALGISYILYIFKRR